MAELSIHHQIATYRMRSQVAKEELKIARARAEQDIIASLNGAYGKNAEERERQLLIGLANHSGYQRMLEASRTFENDLLQAEAEPWRSGRSSPRPARARLRRCWIARLTP